VTFYVNTSGIVMGSIDFYHNQVNCSDPRLLPVDGSAGFVASAYVRPGSVFYTKTTDFTGTLAPTEIHAYEHFELTDDPTVPGTCTALEGGSAPLGVVTMVSDPALANVVTPLTMKR